MKRACTLLAWMLVVSPCALAVNPSLEIRRYEQKTWKNSDGFARGLIESIAQAPGGSAITEGRDAVQGRRSSTVVANNLACSISVRVEGKSRDMPGRIRDEVYRMAAEWTRHAFRRACARRIEIEIHYQKRQFGVRVRDEGKWIDPQVLHEGGRSGHRGIPGVHERAKLAGGNLAVWSDVESGAEIELTIPAVLTYAKAASGREPPASGKGTGLDKNPEIGKL